MASRASQLLVYRHVPCSACMQLIDCLLIMVDSPAATPVPSDMLSSHGASSPSLPSPSSDPSAVPTRRGKIECNVPFCLYKAVTCVTMLKGS